MFLNKKEHVHLIGIGGVGMSAIAEVLLGLGFIISGSDLKKSDTTRHLKSLGAKIYYSHKSDNVKKSVSVVVTSTAIALNNPEIEVAKTNNVIIIHRSEMLSEIMRLKYGIAISGTHGKTTTSSIVSHILSEGKLNPTSIIGGRHFTSNSNVAGGEYIVCEADESDGSFLNLSPVINIVTNIDNDHLDYYKSEEALRLAFLEFINKVPFYGLSFLCFDNDILKDISKEVKKKYYSYGFDKTFDLYASKIKLTSITKFNVHFLGEDLGEFEIPLLGRHNILNVLGSIGVGLYLGIKKEKIKLALLNFKGVGRRLNLKYDTNGIRIYDDYGHHPTEIMATLRAIKDFSRKRLVTVFQPHRYSRSELLFEEFGKAFENSDIVLVTDIYAAGESAKPNINGEIISDEIRKNKLDNVYYVGSINDVPNFLTKNIIKSGDIVLTLGAGDIYKVGDFLYEELQKT